MKTNASTKRESGLSVFLGPIGALKALADDWAALYAESSRSFFLSWDWIRTWIAHVEPIVPLCLVRVEENGRLVGLAVLAEQEVVRSKIVPLQTFFLHETGGELDRLAIEWNGVLAPVGREEEILIAVLDSLFAEMEIDQVCMGGMPYQLERRTESYSVECDKSDTGYLVDLHAVRAHESYPSLLGKNTRQRLRRMKRKLESDHGHLRVREPASNGQADRFFERLCDLHRMYWNCKGEPGAFAPESVFQFHRSLIRRGFSRGEVLLYIVEVGGQEAGYFYCFSSASRVYFYQSGLVERYREYNIGFLAHWAVIDHLAAKGFAEYDFLAGEAQYKKSLSTNQYTLYWLSAQRNGIKRFIRNRASQLKRIIRRVK